MQRAGKIGLPALVRGGPPAFAVRLRRGSLLSLGERRLVGAVVATNHLTGNADYGWITLLYR
jgi:hypothetical protein